MRRMSAQLPRPDPDSMSARSPGERRLERPPSERYRTEETIAPAQPPRPTSDGRALAYGLLATIAGAALITALGGVLTLSAGLLVAAVVTGRAIGLAVVAGGGRAARSSTGRWRAVGLSVGAILLGQLGLWLYARTEGGVLPLPDYLAQTFGILVPVEFGLAAAAAWWSAR